MDKDSRTRKWQITINNPADKGFSHDKIVEILSGMKSLIYYCVSDEIGEAGTYHTHIFLAAANAVRFSTIKKNFEGGHFEMCQGSAAQNRDYVFKEGKWRNSERVRLTYLILILSGVSFLLSVRGSVMILMIYMI